MAELAAPLPACRTELQIQPLGEDGRYVVKDPRSGEFFQLGEAEHFLLTQFNGRRTAEAVRVAYAERFGEPLSGDDLAEFVELARSEGFVKNEGGPVHRPPAIRLSILQWRKNLWDPDRYFTWLAPRIGFFWTPAFLLLSAVCIVAAVILALANRQELVVSGIDALRWETAVVAWFVMFVITLLHECAHGLTCRHFGGEVHEIGVLLLFLMPCFYCNVSDAWLFRERSRRLWVTFAGGYFELFLWALAVFAWRLTLPGTLINYVAFVVLSVGGVQTLLNFIPILKLDGYYLLSDALKIPNLHQRALDTFKVRLRHLLWGGPPPEAEPRARLLFGFGLATWLFSLVFVALVLAALARAAGNRWGWVGLGGVALVGFAASRGLFKDITAGEVSNMIRQRHKRTATWALAAGALAAGFCLVPIEDRVGGTFQVRAMTRAEVRAPSAGFIREVHFEDGDRVSPGATVARLEVPDLSSRITQKRAEVREARAKLGLLEAGPRKEEVREQRSRVERAVTWHGLAQHDLKQMRLAWNSELSRLDKLIAQHQAEFGAAGDALKRSATLAGNAISAEEHREAERRHLVCQARLEQARAERQTLEAKGVLEAEAELARREQYLADARAALSLMETGPRTEEVEAERARLARLEEEANCLQQHRDRLTVCSPVPGLVATSRMREKVGQYVREGELVCIIEEPDGMEIEIALAEEDVARVRAGQTVTLRARALPFETLEARVDRIAPAASRGEAKGTVSVYCRLDGCPAGLRPGMTGYGRIATGSRPSGSVVFARALGWLRTECWWW